MVTTSENKHPDCRRCHLPITAERNFADGLQPACCIMMTSLCRTCTLPWLIEHLDKLSRSYVCPACNKPWGPAYFEKLVGPELFRKHLEAVSKRETETHPCFRWCRSKDYDECDHGQVYEHTAYLESLIICGKCGTVNCYHCKSLYHHAMTCEQYQASKFSETQRAARLNNTRRCPHCYNPITSDGDNRSVKCIKCQKNIDIALAVQF